MSTLSIVVPCYNEEEILEDTAGKLLHRLDTLIESKKIEAGSKIYFVDDGSSDRTWSIITRLCARDERVSGVKLSRNRGHQNALLAGMFTAEGDAIVTIDADLQD